MRKLFYVLNFAILGLFIAAALKDADREWKDYQKAFKKLEVERLAGMLAEAKSDAERENIRMQIKSAKSRPIAIQQMMANDLGRVDRCITCHQGFDPLANPTMTTPYDEHPYKAPKVDVHESHPPTKFGCTSCHAGQGLATTVDDAHGFVKHWEEPLLKSPYIQASCVKCHGDYASLKGARAAARGKKLIDTLGCVGCHSFNGVGGEISVDLGDIADKPVSRIDWAYTGLDRHHWNIKNWIELHFTKDPMVLVPGDPEGHQCAPGQPCEPVPPSGMPPFYKELSIDDAQALTAYLMSQTAKSVPADYFVYAPPAREPRFSDPVAHGRYVFQKYGCAGCHGEGGAAGRRNFNARGPNQTKMEDGVEPTLTTIVGTYSRDELRKKIQDGVPAAAIAKFNEEGPTPPLYMPAWKDKIKGRELESLLTYLFSIAVKSEDEW